MIIEKTVYDYLKEKLDVPVCVQLDDVSKDAFVTIEKTAGNVDTFINYATIVVDSYAPTLYGAALLDEKVREAMLSITDLDEISACSLNGNYSGTDETTNHYIYQANFDLVF